MQEQTDMKCCRKPTDTRKILLTGASGYVGRNLLQTLEHQGKSIRCVARRPEVVRSVCKESTEVVEGDVFDIDSLKRVMNGIHTAYYLIHCLHYGSDFEALDRQAADNFARAAQDAGVRRIIYIGGLAESGAELSPHLRSRQEVGEILKASGAEVIEFRASIIIGTGSLSFELVRSLVERVPIMICPRWVRVPAQPIAINDVLAYLTSVLDLPPGESRIYEIGGRDKVSYGDIMLEYARQRGLPRLLIPVPLLTPWLSSLWLALVTPVHKLAGRRLIEGLRNPSVVGNSEALATFPIRPMGLQQAIGAALADEERELYEKPMSQLVRDRSGKPTRAVVKVGNRILDYRTITAPVGPDQAFKPIRNIGGRVGWYYADWLWDIRGLLDILLGGTGLRRYRNDTERLRVGDRIDCWRVEVYEPGRRLRLKAEMKLPGRGWLEFEVVGDEHSSEIRQTASFDPSGLLGLAYWFFSLPIHNRLFSGMLQNIRRAAVKSR